jgi:hypothetical protein
MLARYVFWVLGILAFGWWGAVAAIRPESLDADWVLRAKRLGVLPSGIERYFRSRWRRTELRIGGVIALAICAFLAWTLLLHLGGVLE